MFSGIVAGTARINSLDKKSGLYTLGVAIPNSLNYSVGSSVSINGVCLTVVAKNEIDVFFEIMQETLNITNLSYLEVGSMVNYEPSIKLGDEIGGHLLSGHISTQAEIIEIIKTENNCQWRLKVDAKTSEYIFPKGFVALDGASLTVGEVKENIFSIHLIPETLKTTTFASVEAGYNINLEIDGQTRIIVDTVKKLKTS